MSARLAKRKLNSGESEELAQVASIDFDDSMLSTPSFQILLHLTATKLRDLQQSTMSGKRQICDILKRHRMDS